MISAPHLSTVQTSATTTATRDDTTAPRPSIYPAAARAAAAGATTPSIHQRSVRNGSRTTRQGKIHQQWIHGVVRTNPGIHVRRIAVLTGLSWNTVRHHLRRLQSADQVVEVKQQGRLCYFDRSQGTHRRKGASVLLREPRNMSIARALVGRPPRPQMEIAQELDLAASVVSRRLDRLEAAGLVQRMAQARCVLVRASDDLAELLERADPWTSGPLAGLVGNLTPHVVTGLAALEADDA